MAENGEVPLFKFGLFADVQYGEKEPDIKKGRYFNRSHTMLTSAVEFFNTQQLQFVLNLGDIIEGSDDEAQSIREMEVIASTLAPLAHPLVHVIGNHCLNYPGLKPGLIQKLTIQSGAPYYLGHKQNGYRFLILDGTDISVKGNAPGTEKYKQAEAWLAAHPQAEFPNAWDWNAAIGSEQLNWLRTQLKEAQSVGDKVIVSCHYPLYEEAAAKEHLLWNHEEVVNVFREFPGVVKVYFAGHFHPGGYHFDPVSLTHHLTFRAILESHDKGPENFNSYGVVEVYEKQVKLQGYGWAREQSKTWVW